MSSYLLIFSLLTLCVEVQDPQVIHVAGVNQGKTLFIQNPYNSSLKAFCISKIRINKKKIDLNTQLSAIKLDFKGFEMFSPVVIEVFHDSICTPVILNPDAIEFHSFFSFKEIGMNDSSLVWKTEGDHPEGNYIVERYQNGFWMERDTIPSKGTFEAAEYEYYPKIEEGPNKFRVKYTFPENEEYLYSMEVDFHYYASPVTFKPFNVTDYLYLSRSASYEIYDGGSNLVLSGTGITIDVSSLPRGDYVIYFDGSDPGLFRKIN